MLEIKTMCYMCDAFHILEHCYEQQTMKSFIEDVIYTTLVRQQFCMIDIMLKPNI